MAYSSCKGNYKAHEERDGESLPLKKMAKRKKRPSSAKQLDQYEEMENS